MQLFDANAFIGSPCGGNYPAASKAELLDTLEKTGTTRALIWHITQLTGAPLYGNALVAEAAAENDNLFGCWAVLPPQTGEVMGDDFFEKMRAGRIAALRAFPNPQLYLLRRRVFGGFMDEVSRRRIPVLLSLEHGLDWPDVYAFLEDYPEITCVLCDIGIWGQDRFTWPLLEGFPRVYIETSYLSLEAGGLDATVERYGAGRLVYGSGFPKRYPEAAILDLLHSQLAGHDKDMIASGNLSALIGEALL